LYLQEKLLAFNTMNTNRKYFLDTPIDCLTMEETINIIDNAMAEKKLIQHVAINVAKLIDMRKSEVLREDVVNADIIGIDGAGIVLGAKIHGIKVPERVAGIDLMYNLLTLCVEKGYKPYILGAKQEVLESAVKNIEEKWQGIQMAGYRNGYFKLEDESQIVEDIKNSGADCLFVAISTPIKERFY